MNIIRLFMSFIFLLCLMSTSFTFAADQKDASELLNLFFNNQSPQSEVSKEIDILPINLKAISTSDFSLVVTASKQGRLSIKTKSGTEEKDIQPGLNIFKVSKKYFITAIAKNLEGNVVDQFSK